MFGMLYLWSAVYKAIDKLDFSSVKPLQMIVISEFILETCVRSSANQLWKDIVLLASIGFC